MKAFNQHRDEARQRAVTVREQVVVFKCPVLSFHAVVCHDADVEPTWAKGLNPSLQLNIYTNTAQVITSRTADDCTHLHMHAPYINVQTYLLTYTQPDPVVPFCKLVLHWNAHTKQSLRCRDPLCTLLMSEDPRRRGIYEVRTGKMGERQGLRKCPLWQPAYTVKG